MKRQRSFPWLGLTFALCAVGALHAESATPEFSAELVQHGSKGESSSGKLYVGDGRTRMEMSQQGQEIIRITDQNRHVEWILLPQQHKYMERDLPAGPSAQPAGAPSSVAADPCAGAPGVTCHKVGEETIAGRAAIKWEMETTHQGNTMKSTQWIDKERGVPLRQEFANGQKTEMSYVGTETVGGRKVEKWEMVTTVPDQPPLRVTQWYDPGLKLVVRQEFPGGFSSELDAIRVGKQPDHLFSIPAGYERISAPQGALGQPPEGSTSQ
jgi:outer membrane lipoprotein-sorting protein